MATHRKRKTASKRCKVSKTKTITKRKTTRTGGKKQAKHRSFWDSFWND
ncbi:MAG: hypothetical protein IJ525_03685 [Alphaproteobacteria bacterium]|nr:hypothetical protein [Alphaproteobacteria bacterium]